MTTLLFYIVVLQFVIQLAFYEAIKNVVIKTTTILHKFIKKLCSSDNKVSKALNFLIGGLVNTNNTDYNNTDSSYD